VSASDYTTLAILKASLTITDTTDDTALSAAITAASRAVDRYTGTTFYPITETRTFSPDSATECPVDAIGADAGLVVQVGTGGTYGTTLTTVYPWPYNAIKKGGVYTRLTTSYGPLFPYGYREPTVSVTAAWGYPSVPADVASAVLIKAARVYRRKDTPEGVAGSGDYGVVRVSKYEDPDVVLLLEPFVFGTGFA
jgi:hypothetical protein